MKNCSQSRSSSLTRRFTPLALLGNRASTIICVGLSVGALVFSGLNPQQTSGLQMSVTELSTPVFTAISRPVQESVLFMRNITGVAEMHAENMRLQKENLHLLEWYQAAQLFEAENQSLRTLLNLKIEEPKSYITARILADTGNPFARSLLVAGGQEDGVKKGQAVVSSDGVIGRVIEAGTSVSRILLLSDINSRVPVMIEGDGIHAILAGGNDETPRLERFPPDYRPKEGARIITSGVGGLYPQGLPVGRAQSSKDGLGVTLYTDTNQLLYVRVIEKLENFVLQAE